MGSFVVGFKSSVTININEHWKAKGIAVWQRNFHDHIIRDEHSYEIISAYIFNNPKTWKEDCFFEIKE
ncbi:MAG: hypothetical protein WCQ95_01350 [Bacteroidota bacterium]